jgi:predicted SAM-dependent methyltransferase
MSTELLARTITAHIKRSQFAVGAVKTFRGLAADARVLVWLAARKRRIADYLETHQVKKLQLGTSNNVRAGWLNTDIFLNHKSVVYVNATKRFPFEDESFDYVMAEHMIEHVEYPAAQVMLRECFRVLKPGGRVRLSTPDLRVMLSLLSTNKTQSQWQYINWLTKRLMPEVRECKEVFVINNAFHAWGHRFLYDRETLSHALHTSGFREVKFYKPGESDDHNLIDVESHGKEIDNEEINQFETIVVEAHKPVPFPVPHSVPVVPNQSSKSVLELSKEITSVLRQISIGRKTTPAGLGTRARHQASFPGFG